MKKSIFLAMLSAIVLTGTMTFTACSSQEDAVEPNPTFDGESVKTTFTISIGDVKSPTRMAATAVQADETFQGMTDIYLFPFTEAVAADKVINESYIHLADIAKTQFPDASVAKAKGKIYNDVNLSVGVNNFLFYGATAEPGIGKLKPSYLSLTDANWATGYTTWAPVPINKGASKVGDYGSDPYDPTKINGITFDLVPIRRGWTLANVKANDKAVATIKPLNDADAALTTAISGITGESATETAAKNKLTEIQKTLRNELTAGTYTAYAGSSNSIKSLMEMLYATLKNLAGSTLKKDATSSYGDGVMTAIEESFTATENSTTGEWELAWKTDPDFPANLGVPDGAAAVQYKGSSDTAPFEFVTTSVEGLAVPAISNYTYPARLYYTVNTPSMVKDVEYLKNAGNAYDTWKDLREAQYTLGAIAANTRSVIMQDQVQYAVGRLDVNVLVKPETIINDNSKEAEQPVTVPTGGYQLTGVLIGGQKQVGWDFTPIDGAPEMTIWDNSMTSTINATQGSDFAGPNRTLALETKANTSINIALEFVNTGNDFCGVDHNVIPAGTKFYLVANLDPTTNTTYKVQDPETPWNPGTEPIKQVIKQDYVTTVNLTIGANSLKSAYNVVPDLRSPKLEFGLSVDLHWRNGITFEQEF